MRLKPVVSALSVPFTVLSMPLAVLSVHCAMAFPVFAATTAAPDNTVEIERIAIQGDFRQSSVQQLSGSLAVVSEQDA
jgi:hypothetical protein